MPLHVGAQAPDFTLLDSDMQPVSLSSLQGQKVMLAFFPAAFTGVCKAEACNYQTSMQRLNGAGYKVLGVTADLPFSNGAFRTENNLEFPILSDWNGSTIKNYDVEWPNFAGIEGLTRSSRATFLINEHGVIDFVDVTANPGVEPNYDELYAAAGAK